MTLAARNNSAAKAEALQSIDPATGEIVGAVPLTAVEEIPLVVQRARNAQDDWSKLSHRQRADQIAPAAAKIAARVEELALLTTREMGKPLKDAITEVSNQAKRLPRKLDEMVASLGSETFEHDLIRSTVYFEPFGVCAVIAPWNFPVAEPLLMLVPALMAGNAVILKPSEETPLVGELLADILNESLPPNILQVVHGADEQGKALVAADGVELIVFTGSQAAGKDILSTASKTLKRVILELGGKDPLIVLDDADVTEAARFAAFNSFRNSGQVCVGTERIYVDSKLADEFEQEMLTCSRELKIGPGTQNDVDFGPMVNRHQKDSVLRKIDVAKREGARVLLDGGAESSTDDNFLQPTILTDLDQSMSISREETFGPVACIYKYSSIDDAVQRANDTSYGLGAIVFGKDVKRAATVARRIEAGMIGINRGCAGALGTPWIGIKQSGYGWHSGKEGHRQFAQPRVVSIATDA